MKWEPIETAPKDGTAVDLWVGGERVSDCEWINNYDGFCRFKDDGDCGMAWVRVDHEHGTPTHWMPLPQPPTTEAP